MDKILGQPIREGMRAEYAYTHIKRLILEGHFRGGDRLDVNSFVRQLEVSRQPVVRALARLADEKLVEVVPQVGCWVARVSTEEIGDFFRLFAATEALVAELAAARHAAVDLVRLRSIDARIGALLATGEDDVHAYRMLNREFHGQVHAMAHSTLLHDAAAGMWDRCDFFLSTLGRNLIALRIPDSHREHAELISALERRAAPVAKRIMGNHIAAFGTAALREADAPETAPVRRVNQ